MGEPCLLVDFLALRADSARESLVKVSGKAKRQLESVLTLFGRSGLGHSSATSLEGSAQLL